MYKIIMENSKQRGKEEKSVKMKKQIFSVVLIMILIIQTLFIPAISSAIASNKDEELLVEDYVEEEQEESPEENKEEIKEKSEDIEPNKEKKIETTKEKPEESKKSLKKKTDENKIDELEKKEKEEVVPVETEIAESSKNVKSFKSNISAINDLANTANHTIKPVDSENMCLREIEGTVNIDLPVPTEKKPLDIVVVQDASGSYAGNENQVKQSLKDIVDKLNLTQDRMMVTSYRGYIGYKQYTNLTNYNRGIIYNTRNRGSSEQGLTTTNHTNLSNNARDLKNKIQNINFGGATPTSSGLKFAKDEYIKATSGQDLTDRETVFILITDGVANAQLDGYLHLNRQISTSWAESNQFYQQTFNEVSGIANEIKGLGYEMISAYWENKAILQNGYGKSYYDQTIGPAARAMLKGVASSESNYSSSENLAELIETLLDNLQTTIDQYSGFKYEFEVAPGFELIENSVQLNGTQIAASQTGEKVVATANRVKSAKSKLTYKLREKEVHSKETTPVTKGKISYDRVANNYTKTLTIPNASLIGNPNSDKCVINVKKSIALDNSNEFTDSLVLDKINDLFTYKLEYQFDENVGLYDKVQLKDELESVLELSGATGNIIIKSDDIPNLNTNINMLNNASGFIIDILKVNDTYNYLAGKKITVTFQAKIKNNVTKAQLESYVDKKIPNETALLLDGEPNTSPKVFVKPPKEGTIKIVKVDSANSNIKLAGAKFEIRDSEGNKVEELTTDKDGIALSKELPAGEYTLVETKAPTGYEIDTTYLPVNVEKGKETTQTITNKKILGQIVITKVDHNENPLADATFELINSNGEKIETKTSDANGEIIFDNLNWGDYLLKETKAPEGYRLLSKEIELTINKEKLLLKETIKNSKQGWNLPDTGGIGTLGFYGIGILLMLLAAWFLFRKNKAK